MLQRLDQRLLAADHPDELRPDRVGEPRGQVDVAAGRCAIRDHHRVGRVGRDADPQRAAPDPLQRVVRVGRELGHKQSAAGRRTAS